MVEKKLLATNSRKRHRFIFEVQEACEVSSGCKGAHVTDTRNDKASQTMCYNNPVSNFVFIRRNSALSSVVFNWKQFMNIRPDKRCFSLKL